jgi:hypothetical protein
MAVPSDHHGEVRPRLTAAILFLCAGASQGWALWIFLDRPLASWDTPAVIAAWVSPLLFLSACVLVFFRPHVGYTLGVVAGLLAVPWLVENEFSPATWNSWVTLNYESPLPTPPGEGSYIAFTGLKILSVFLVVTAIVCSLLRLLPIRWSFRQLPLYGRTWPAFVVGFLVIAVWFGFSVAPYRVPAYDHPASAEFRILHLEKRGLRFNETMVMVRRNGQAWVLHSNPRLLQYRFEERVASASLYDASPTASERARAFAQSSALWNLRTGPATPLRSWNAEGWYIVLKDSRLLTFTSEQGAPPPKEVTDWFHQIESLPLRDEQRFALRDVCFGFCYDPVAALGFAVLPQRIRLLRSNAAALPSGHLSAPQ